MKFNAENLNRLQDELVEEAEKRDKEFGVDIETIVNTTFLERYPDLQVRMDEGIKAMLES